MAVLEVRPTPIKAPRALIQVSDQVEAEGDDEVFQKSPEQKYIDAVRDEIDGYFVQLKTLNNVPPEEIFSILSAITARLSEIRGRLWRNEGRRSAALRSREVEPMLETVDKLFKIHSRSIAWQTLEWDHIKGQV